MKTTDMDTLLNCGNQEIDTFVAKLKSQSGITVGEFNDRMTEFVNKHLPKGQDRVKIEFQTNGLAVDRATPLALIMMH